jgi:hypothetical protein
MKEIPDCPPKIIDSYREGNLCLFIGAGVSRLAGCPSWEQLCRNILVDQDVKLDPKIKEILLSEKNNKKLLTLISKNFNPKESEKRELEFFQIIKRHLTPKTEELEIYNKLKQLDVLKITTNADLLIEQHLMGHFPVCYENFQKYWVEINRNDFGNRWKKNRLFKIHGTVNPSGGDLDWQQLIFTTTNYLKQYRKPDFQKFLSMLFANFTVLFIGYSMSEFELLQYMLEPQKRHFLLEGYFSFEEMRIKLEKDYYDELNIELVHFNYDRIEHKQLIKVIERWVSILVEEEKSDLIRGEIKNPDISENDIAALLDGDI